MKQGVSHDTRRNVLDLRRTHSLREVAEKTNLPLGTVKTLCRRSGEFADNQAVRLLFALPEPDFSTTTALAVQELPAQQVWTGDKEIDAVLWLHEVIKTGQAGLIEKAMEAAKRIKTPLKELSDRHLKHLVSRNPGDWTVAFATFGFDDLDGLAKKSTEKLTRKSEALARFGSQERLFSDTPAEQFCVDALAGLKLNQWSNLVDDEVDERLRNHPEMEPHTLSDCLYELAYWQELHRLRSSVVSCDSGREAYAREQYAFRRMATIRPRTKQEAVAVFRYLAEEERMQDDETEGILLNLIGSSA